MRMSVLRKLFSGEEKDFAKPPTLCLETADWQKEKGVWGK
jgi:hypothetical protein